MMNLRDVFRDLVGSWRVQFLFLSPGCGRDEASSLDFQFRDQLYEDFDYVSYVRNIMNLVPKDNVISFQDDFGLHYLVFPGAAEDAGNFGFFGPYVHHTVTPGDFDVLLKRHGLSESSREALQWFFKRIPVIQDPLPWRQMFNSLLSRYLSNPDVAIRTVRYDRMGEAREKPAISLSSIPYTSLEARYEVEAAMLDAIRRANISEAIYQQNLFMGFTLDKRVADDLRDAKDMVIAANTLFRKAAEQAAVHPLYIDGLSGQYVREIEAAEGMTDLQTLTPKMVRGYCRLVQIYSREQYSDPVRKALNYIDFHYMEPLTLDSVARQFSVNKNYLSTRFHKEVGVTVTEYINRIRVQRSLKLLSASSASMQDIAEQCGFSDANYFSRTFRKIHGQTPMEYRKATRTSP